VSKGSSTLIWIAVKAAKGETKKKGGTRESAGKRRQEGEKASERALNKNIEDIVFHVGKKGITYSTTVNKVGK